MTDVIELIDRAIDGTDRIIEGIPGNAWTAPTACAGWDVRTVVNHLVGGARIFAAQLRGAVAPGDHEDDWLGADPVAAWRRAAAEDRAAWHLDGALRGSITISLGELPAELGAWIHLTELVVHGHDVARATGQRELDDELAEALLAAMQALGFDAFRTPDTFGSAQAVPDEAPAHLRLAAYTGRAVPVPA